MKEVKAYIRLEKADAVIHALEDAGVSGFTVLEVKAIGGPGARENERFSVEYAERFSPVVKLEAVCNDVDEKKLISVISEKALTGQPGDGMIFVSDVLRAIKIRTGESGPAVLGPVMKNN